jgi:hypothetical protein
MTTTYYCVYRTCTSQAGVVPGRRAVRKQKQTGTILNLKKMMIQSKRSKTSSTNEGEVVVEPPSVVNNDTTAAATKRKKSVDDDDFDDDDDKQLTKENVWFKLSLNDDDEYTPKVWNIQVTTKQERTISSLKLSIKKEFTNTLEEYDVTEIQVFSGKNNDNDTTTASTDSTILGLRRQQPLADTMQWDPIQHGGGTENMLLVKANKRSKKRNFHLF